MGSGRTEEAQDGRVAEQLYAASGSAVVDQNLRQPLMVFGDQAVNNAMATVAAFAATQITADRKSTDAALQGLD